MLNTEGYKREDIKRIENVAYLDGYEQAILDTTGFLDHLEIFSADSLIIHKLSVSEEDVQDIKEALKRWTDSLIDQVLVSILDEEACNEG